ncbi:unnamed protein product [Sphagnum tenellum]
MTSVESRSVEALDVKFSPLRVSTTTVTTNLGFLVNIVDVAKYLPLDDEILGVKLVYAGGTSTIMRGAVKLSKKKRDFLNQVTLTIRFIANKKQEHVLLASSKIFHNGTLHITGTRTQEESQVVTDMLRKKISLVTGWRLIELRSCLPILVSFDNLVYNQAATSLVGRMVTFFRPRRFQTETLYINNEHVKLEKFSDVDMDREEDVESVEPIPEKSTMWVLVTTKWLDQSKNIYTLDGKLVGQKKLVFDNQVYRRHFEVKFGCIFSGNKVVGQEQLLLKKNYQQQLSECQKYHQRLQKQRAILHSFVAGTIKRRSVGQCRTRRKTRFQDTHDQHVY